jgi:anti-anti-sigma factor
MVVPGYAPWNLPVDVTHHSDCVSVVPHGELDIATCELLEHRIGPLLEGDALHLVVDLSSLSFIDVAGLRALARCAAVARTHGVRFSVKIADQRLRRLLALSHLLDDCELIPAPPAPESR